MASPFSLRLDQKTRRRIARIARSKQVSTSDVVRSAIAALAEREEAEARPYERIADLLGADRGCNRKRSEQTGKRFRKVLRRARKRR